MKNLCGEHLQEEYLRWLILHQKRNKWQNRRLIKKLNLHIAPSTEDSLEPIVDFDLCEADGSTPNAAHEPGKGALLTDGKIINLG